LRFFRAVAMSITRCRGSHRLAPLPQMSTPAAARARPVVPVVLERRLVAASG
jgi:hypothetical protein